jgi:hypothetical protein
VVSLRCFLVINFWAVIFLGCLRDGLGWRKSLSHRLGFRLGLRGRVFMLGPVMRVWMREDILDVRINRRFHRVDLLHESNQDCVHYLVTMWHKFSMTTRLVPCARTVHVLAVMRAVQHLVPLLWCVLGTPVSIKSMFFAQVLSQLGRVHVTVNVARFFLQFETRGSTQVCSTPSSPW